MGKKKAKGGKKFMGKGKEIEIKLESKSEDDFEPFSSPVPSDPDKGSIPKAPLLTHLFVLPPTVEEIPYEEGGK